MRIERGDPYVVAMLRLPAVVLLCVSILLLFLALRRLSVNNLSGCSGELLRKSQVLRATLAPIALGFCIMAAQFVREASQPEGFREDLFGAVISIFIAGFVYAAAGLTSQTARLFNELASMRTLAHQDALTGLFNRRYFDTALHKAIELARLAGEPLSLIAIDIDNLKQVNDRYGHGFGDEVIRRVCEAITSESRARDAVVRLGGDELMIIAQGTGGEAALAFASRVRKLVERIDIAAPHSGVLPVSISIGIANHRHGESPADLISRADEAMYRSKMGGRNRVSSDQNEGAAPVFDYGLAAPQFRSA